MNPRSTFADAIDSVKTSGSKLAKSINQVSTGVVNSMSLEARFPVSRRIARPSLYQYEGMPAIDELESWALRLGITLGDLIPTQSDRIRVLELLYAYRHLNGSDLTNLPATDLITHRVRMVPGTRPYSARSQRRWPPHLEWWLNKLVQDGMSGGLYERTECSNGRLSAWNAKAVLVDKVENPGPEDEPRLTFNYSNVKEEMPGCHLELTSKVHDYLSDPRHNTFFQADIKHAYYSVLVHPEDRHVFAFTLPGIGQLQPTRMPQGSGSAGFTMSELMNIALGPIPEPLPEPSLLHSEGDSAQPPPLAFYMDDLFGGYPDFETQFSFLRDHFFPRIEWAQLQLAFKKLKLFVRKVTALGVDHIIGGKIQVIPDRVKVILEWPIPLCPTDIRAFLGTVGITKRWVKNFSEMARPLHRLTGRVPWRWGPSEELSFEIVKLKCATRSMMFGIDWSVPVRFYSDASGYAAGLVITQIQKDERGVEAEVPIIYDSFTFTASQRKYPTYKRELCAMVRFACKYDYLLRYPSLPGLVFTDHKPLIHFLNSELHDGIYGHWAAKLRELNIKITYIEGARNTVADGLSRTIFAHPDCEEDAVVHAIKNELEREGPQWIWKDGKGGYEAFLKTLDLQEKAEVITNGTLHSVEVFVNTVSFFSNWYEAYQDSQWFGDIFRYLQGLPITPTPRLLRKCLDYRIYHGVLWITRKEIHLVCVPESKVSIVLQEVHDNGGHWGKESTLLRLKGNAFWPSQSTDVEKYIAGCIYCAKHAPAQRSHLLQPVVTSRPFQLMAMDFIGPLKKTSSGNSYILHVMDYFSRFSFTFAYPTANASDVVLALTTIFETYTTPSSIYCDRGQHFENQVVKAFLSQYKVLLVLGPSGSSKSFGLIELGNRLLETVLRKTDMEWDSVLRVSTHQLNRRTITHLKHSPSQILMGLDPSSPSSLRVQATMTEYEACVSSIQLPEDHYNLVQQHLTYLYEVRARIDGLSRDQKQKMKDRYDRKVKLQELSRGDYVMLYQKETGKLEARWRGPFVITGYGGTHGVSFIISQLNGRRIKGTFHGDHLKVFQPRFGYLSTPHEPVFSSVRTIRNPRR